MTDQHETASPEPAGMPDIEARRGFLCGLGKWSQAVIGGVLLGGALAEAERANAWVAARSRRGSAVIGPRGGWVNRYGGGSWANRSGGGGWLNGGGWVNRSSGWLNGGGGSAGWINRYGGGAAWINRR
ncbi:MAG TPA: hypothetical protein PKY50_14160 [Candidatus Competibacter sp.]|nr:hypothetical protein [Candidatus Competibacter sp.]